MGSLQVKHKVILTIDNREMIDDQLIVLLEKTLEHGSLLSAAKTLGITYSRAWEMIRRTERILGKPLISTTRGRKGSSLTAEALQLIDAYKREIRKIESCLRMGESGEEDKVIVDVAYSHDPLLEIIIDKLGFKRVCAGSLRSLAMLALDTSRIACSHLYEHGEKAEAHFLEKLGIDKFHVLGGYWRQISLAYNPRIGAPGGLYPLLKEVLLGRLTVAPRNRGSATRVLLDELLEETAERYGIPFEKRSIKGYSGTYWKHDDVARAIAIGKADVGLTLTYSATLYRIPFIPVRWEKYECYSIFIDEHVKRFSSALNSRWLRGLLDSSAGYSFDKPMM
ncbi:MAG: LysR family transcriptional regulator [Desulfurococcales archaeon]|nr:LysR family transcriptional regulator [Desulfurococcales archaeon]